MAAYTYPEGFDDFDMLAFGSALLVVGLLGFFLNSVSALAFLRVKEIRTPTNFFIFNLAIADIGLNINGLVAAYASYLRHWPFGTEGCQTHGFQGMVSLLAAISFLACIAWDRYHQYCTRQKMFWSTTWTMSIIIWGLAIFWSALPLPSFGWSVYDFEPMRTCCCLDYTRGDRDYITYVMTLLVLYLLFPLLTMHSSYNTIYAYFKKTHHHTVMTECQNHAARHGASNSVKTAIERAFSQFNTTLPIKALLFCWGPYVALCIYACFGNAKIVPPKLRMVFPVLAKTSTIFHAILYAYGNEFYRGGIWQFLTGQKAAILSDKKK